MRLHMWLSARKNTNKSELICLRAPPSICDWTRNGYWRLCAQYESRLSIAKCFRFINTNCHMASAGFAGITHHQERAHRIGTAFAETQCRASLLLYTVLSRAGCRFPVVFDSLPSAKHTKDVPSMTNKIHTHTYGWSRRWFHSISIHHPIRHHLIRICQRAKSMR